MASPKTKSNVPSSNYKSCASIRIKSGLLLQLTAESIPAWSSASEILIQVKEERRIELFSSHPLYAVEPISRTFLFWTHFIISLIGLHLLRM
jgi:hypothetical protein